MVHAVFYQCYGVRGSGVGVSVDIYVVFNTCTASFGLYPQPQQVGFHSGFSSLKRLKISAAIGSA